MMDCYNLAYKSRSETLVELFLFSFLGAYKNMAHRITKESESSHDILARNFRRQVPIH